MKRVYYKRKSVNEIFYILESNGFQYECHLWGRRSPVDYTNTVPASPSEIDNFETIEKERKEKREKAKKAEANLLSLCGLTHDDFVRFRDVSRFQNILYVSTRENGMGERSIKAIKNKNYIRSQADDGDPTYENYEFIIKD
jgi:hypothetical protein